MNLPVSLYTSADVREIDRIAIEESGIPGYTLMSRAGQAALDLLRKKWPHAIRLTVVCGMGNNAGDGYVVARLAREQGLEVRVLQLGDVQQLKGDALTACEDLRATGFDVTEYQHGRDLASSDVIVDAILGTGLQREVSGLFREAIEQINHSGVPVLSLDIPSGLDADRGVVMGAAVRASCTITFIGLKQGMFTAYGPDYCGEVHFHGLEVPATVVDQVPVFHQRISADRIRSLLSPRKPSTHKGMCGHVLVIGGDHGMLGAVLMAGLAAARCGAGLVSLATRASHAALIPVYHPELMSHGVEDTKELEPLLARANVVCIGPGLGQDEWGQQMLARILETHHPLVVDADALNLLAQEPCARGHWVLTPHPGEASRLLDKTSGEIQRDRFSTCIQLQQHYQGVVVLKGAGTLVSSGDKGEVFLCDRGNPGMASGGMGDILTGVIGALIAQGLDMEQSAQAGVWVHACAADTAAQKGQRGLLATDLLEALREQVNPVVSRAV